MDRRLRIGELSKRTGVRPDLLRAWERRYGLLRPTRSDAGYRLYSPEDEERVRAMVRQLGAGAPAGEAARLVLDGAAVPEPTAPALPAVPAELREALDRFDDAGAQTAFDNLISALSFETVARHTEIWAEREGERGVVFASMHPGWADTPGRRSPERSRASDSRALHAPFRSGIGARDRSPTDRVQERVEPRRVVTAVGVDPR